MVLAACGDGPSRFTGLGTLRVKDTLPETSELAMRRLMHGVIMHGEQFLHPSRRMDVTTYYGPSSGVGIAIDYFRRAIASKPGIISPCILKLGSSAARVCMVVVGRMNSSWPSSSTPFWSFTATIDFLK